jgi:DNA sulfur modification protein DndB
MPYSVQVQQGRQGLHKYFTATMRWGELDHVLVFPDDLGDIDEDEQMQRGVAKKRIRDLVDYIVEEGDHFFSALTLIILPRDHSRPAREGGKDDEDEDEWDWMFEKPTGAGPRERVGTLWLSGDVRLFPADGQHRALAAITALEEDSDIAKEEVPVVLIPFQSADQVRQLFADLNLNAKPVSKTIGWDFSRRDPIAVIAKHAMHEVELFQGRVNRRTNSLPGSSQNVITLNTLVSGSRSIAAGLAAHVENEAGTDGVSVDEYVSDTEVASQDIAAVWAAIIDAFSDYWGEVLKGTKTPGEIRAEYLFPHGLGWQAITQAAGELIKSDPDAWEERFRAAVGSLDWRRQAPAWQGTAVIPGTNAQGDPTYRVNNTAPAVKDLAAKILAAARI